MHKRFSDELTRKTYFSDVRRQKTPLFIFRSNNVRGVQQLIFETFIKHPFTKLCIKGSKSCLSGSLQRCTHLREIFCMSILSAGLGQLVLESLAANSWIVYFLFEKLPTCHESGPLALYWFIFLQQNYLHSWLSFLQFVVSYRMTLTVGCFCSSCFLYQNVGAILELYGQKKSFLNSRELVICDYREHLWVRGSTSALSIATAENKTA